jgi:hypothetical protein
MKGLPTKKWKLVVDEVCDKINELLETISDNSNFDQHNVNKFYLKF